MSEKRDVPISYRKSFLAKYILSDDRCKEVYSILKNKLMSINGMKSRISWFYDAFNIGRLNFAKLSVRGKYVALYLNLGYDDYPLNIYHQEFVGDRRRFGDTSFKIHVKSNRTLKYAFRLIDDEIKKFNLKTGPIPKENYYLEYENELSLIQRGLIKLSNPTNYTYQAEEQLPVDNYKREENLFTEDYTKQVIFVDGSKVFVKERKSFEAKLIQSSQELQTYYSTIKNQLLSFTKVKSKISWKYESFNLGKAKLAKLQIRGKYLVLYLNLDLSKYPKRKGIEDSSKYKAFQDTPLTLRIKNQNRLNYAIELIDDLKKRFLLEEGFLKESHDYNVEFQGDEDLKAKGLIKVYARFGEESPEELLSQRNEEVNKKKNNFAVYREEKRLTLTVDKNNNFVETEEIVKIPLDGNKEVVYLDVLEKLFNEDEIVDINSLKDKKIISEDTDYFKVIYRGGEINKKLNIIASAESPSVKKILEEIGGTYKVGLL
ncbi:MAG: uL15 family ribosomal protein [Gammaproteobacteria bacterium]|nr:uL15 family ribosomal protein [Gammaproteobacteria bacterium]